MPQTVPIWVKLSPRSSEISGNKTGMDIMGRDVLKIRVIVERVSIYHLLVGLTSSDN